MSAYYNENDPYAAQWLKNLIAAGHIAPGFVDSRSIEDIKPSDLEGYTQHHFFAGLGGWSYALRLAGWPDDQPVWTGSCPCQPFSTAGKGIGLFDTRHLWPAWFWLIQQYRPNVIFGEQVGTAIRHGWLDHVFTDLERIDYTCGATIIPASAVGAPHKRERLWFVAESHGNGWEPRAQTATTMGYRHSFKPKNSGTSISGNSTNWNDAEWITCADGKSRFVKPGIRLLAHGIPARVGKLRAFGNAIVPQVAAEFIRACK